MVAKLKKVKELRDNWMRQRQMELDRQAAEAELTAAASISGKAFRKLH